MWSVREPLRARPALGKSQGLIPELWSLWGRCGNSSTAISSHSQRVVINQCQRFGCFFLKKTTLLPYLHPSISKLSAFAPSSHSSFPGSWCQPSGSGHPKEKQELCRIPPRGDSSLRKTRSESAPRSLPPVSVAIPSRS